MRDEESREYITADGPPMMPLPADEKRTPSRWMRRDLARLARIAAERPVLVTGATGFIGRRLVPYLRAADVSVLGVSRRGGGPGRRLRHDLGGDAAPLAACLARRPPAVVFHLAAPEPVPGVDTVALVEASLRQTQGLLDVCLGLSRRPLFVLVSSSAVYGAGGRGSLLERRVPTPATFHGVAKVLSEALASRAAAEGLPVLRVRPFNIIGPGQRDTRVLPRFARQVADLETGRSRAPVSTLGLGAVRDFLDVRDIVTALVTVAARGAPGAVYNICSGRGVRVGELLERLVALTDLTDVTVQSRGDHGVDRNVGNPGLVRALGWRPRYPLARTVRDVLDEWRARPPVASSASRSWES